MIHKKSIRQSLAAQSFRYCCCLGIMLLLVACGKSQTPAKSETSAKIAVQPIAKDLKPTYVCPMHPNIVRDHPGHCPICGMDLVKKEVHHHEHTKPVNQVAAKTVIEPIAKGLKATYVCPMHPNIVRDHPGHCPICGMDLVKKDGAHHEHTDEQHVVDLAPDVVQKLGVRTAKVVRGDLPRTIRTVGYVAYDRDMVSDVSVATAGWVENLSKKRIGLRVNKGELLVSLYSPEFLRVQKDYLAAQKKDKSGVLRKYSARRQSVGPRDQLRYMGISDSLAYDIARSGKPRFRIPIYAPRYGEIVKYNVKKDQFIPANYPIFTIADLSYVWVIADVYEHQMEFVQRNLQAEVEVNALPGQHFKAHVYYIYPELDPKTRTLKVRLLVSNPHWQLKPNMFADVRIFNTPESGVLKIPREALIVTGRRESVVLDRGNGHFQPVDVVSGMRSGDEVEILSGLKEGDKVVVSGQFLIDSEANLQASFARFGAEK